MRHGGRRRGLRTTCVDATLASVSELAELVTDERMFAMRGASMSAFGGVTSTGHVHRLNLEWPHESSE